MPILLAVRITLQAISPLFAMRTLAMLLPVKTPRIKTQVLLGNEKLKYIISQLLRACFDKPGIPKPKITILILDSGFLFYSLKFIISLSLKTQVTQ